MSEISEPDSAAELAADLEGDLEAERLALLDLLLEEEAEEAAAPAAAIGHATAPERIPLSLSQRRLWIADRLDPGTALFNIPASQRLSGELDIRALRAALQALVDRHESLRTTFSTADGNAGARGSSEGFQVIARHREVDLPRIDLSLLPLSLALQTSLRLSGLSQSRGFDLEQGPLLRFALIEMAPRDNVLLVTMHHIVADGWSLSIFQREFAAFYAGFAKNQPATLPALPIQYADFALWQRDWLRGEVLENQLAFWRDHLADAPFLAELPTDRPRPRVRNFRGGKVARLVADSVTEAFHRLVRGEGVTYFASALALGHAWLGRLTRSDDALIGSPIAGRHRIETEGVIGFFVSNLVFRAQLRGDPTARELLVRTREETLAILSHQDVPFDLLVEALAPERDLSTTPIYQVQLMAFEGQRRADASAHAADETARTRAMGGLRLTPLTSGDEMSMFDLSMTIAEGGRRLALQYNRDLFDAATIERMAGYFENLMAAFVAEPDRHLSEIAMIGQDERRQLLLEWNPPSSRAAFSQKTLLPEWVAIHAKSRPQAIAVEMGDMSLTYAELDERSNALARYLAMFGVGPEVRVGLCLMRSLDLVVGLIAVQKAGGAYLPLDPTYPIDRLAGMIEDAGLMLLLAQDATLDALPAGTAYVINLDRTDEMAAMMGDGGDEAGDGATPEPPPGPCPEHLAYVIFTSGSTGRPKGVMLAHDGLANLCAEQARIFAVGPESRVLQFASVSFDASVAEIAVALCAGAALVLGAPDDLLPGPGLVRLLASRRITKATIPPSALAVLPAGAEAELPDLRTLVVAGEACSPELAAIWGRGRRFVNAYGPTEATVCATAELFVEGKALTLGRPLSDVEIHVLGSRFEPLPVGVAGELLIGGRGLARGYLNRPDLTAERFVPHPFAAERGDFGDPGARLYRTGDLVRRLADGRIEFLGRIDHQVKVRGFRIELGEIEAALRAQAGVREVVVLARNDSGGGLSGGNADRLVAYLLAEPERELVPADLKAALSARLPEYMVPAAFVVLGAFPLTANGKVDRKALPTPELAHLHVEGVRYEAPRDAIETLVAEVFGEVLGLSGEISIHDSFFDLGGHSLLATQLLSRVRDAFGVELALRQVFEAQTIASFSRAIEAAQREARGLESGPIERRPRVAGADLPLSFAQERLWFLDQLEPGSPTYNIPSALRVRGALDPLRLAAALRYLERRHESLRTTFPTRAGRAAQEIAAPDSVDSPRGALLFARVDLAALSEARREVETLRLAGKEAIRPFDLATGPLGRVVLVHLSPQPATEQALLLTVHHVISDGWSMGVFVRELAEVHSALVEGREPDANVLPPLPIQYADFAAWQRGWLTGDVLARQIDHWRRHLLGAPELLALPTDRPRPAIQSYRGASVARPSAPGTVERLHALSRAEGATLFMTLLAGWSTLLYRYTGQTDIPVGTPIANRNRAEVEGLIGFFVNTLVLRTRVAPRQSFRALLGTVRESTLEGYAHQDLPFEKLVEAIAPERNLSYSPLFQSMLVLQNNPDRPLELPGLEISGLAMSGEVSKYDLTLNAIELGPRLACRVVYSTALFEAATVERILGHLHALLHALLDQPDRPVGTLDLFSGEERRTLLIEWNEPAVVHPSEGYLPQMFEERVDAGPARIAVEFDSRTESERAAGGAGFSMLTYAELDARANRLARHLRRAGVGPETRVGVCLERSLDLPVALLAVLKAGAAYLPLDPSLPEDRLRHLVADASAPVVVTVGRFVERLGTDRTDRFDRFGGPHLVLLDDAATAAAIAEEPAERLLPAALGEHPAYVIYTSGSTGQPKGVVVTHGALGNRLRYALATDFATDAEVFLQKTTISFDVSVLEIFAPLVSGGRTVLPEPEGHRDPAYLVRLIAERRITQASFPPSTLALLLDSGALDECRDLRLLVTGGETVPADLPNRVHERLPWIDVYNRYGPTEATISVTSWLCRPDAAERSLPIGRPTAKAHVYLLDREGEPTPVGVPGELHLGGICLARGYLDRPAMTAAAFVPNPFSETPGERLYATGDLAKWRADGAIDFVGRIDGQIKIRGFRVELGEIEAALYRCPGVREAAVIDREDTPGQKRLVAYFVPEVADAEAPAEPSDLPRALRERLAAELPAYMVPAAFVAIEKLPLSPTGKVDRKALPAPPAEAATVSGYAPPRTETETLLAAIWAEALGLSRVGIHDNYFALGGDSILSIQIVARANQAGCRIAPRQLFQHQTVAELAAVAGTIDAVEAEQGAVTGEAPLSPIQSWFLASDRPDRHWFNQSFLVSVERGVEPAAVEQAISTLVEHHDALRLRFEKKLTEGWRQELAPVGSASDLPFVHVDLSDLPVGERRAALEAKCAALQSSLDLENGPILRAALFDLGADEPRRLLLAIHHLAVDGVSWRILFEDLENALAGRDLPAKTTSWKAWTEKLAALDLEGEAADWQDRPEISFRLPIEPRGENLVSAAKSVAVSFDAEETRSLLQAPAAYRAQIQDLLLTALQATLAGDSPLPIELEGHGREEDLVPNVDLTRTVGWFTTLYPVTLEVPANAGPGERLKSIKERLHTLPSRGLSHGVLRWLGRSETRTALAAFSPPEVSFNYLGQADASARGAGQASSASPSTLAIARENPGPTLSPLATRAHELAVSAVISGGALRVELIYGAERLAKETVEAWAAAFRAEALALAEHCASPEAFGYTPSDFPLARLDQATIDRLFGDDRTVEDVYPLAPLQEGMVFQTLAAPRSGVYYEQLAATLSGPVDDNLFGRALAGVLARHPILRTSFRWQGSESLLQVVQHQVEPPLLIDDWRDVPAGEIPGRLAALLEADRRAGFALDRAPLVAARLIRTDEDERTLVLANHHAILDGWSYQSFTAELFALYAGLRSGRAPELPHRRPYRDYIAWLVTRDRGASEAYWRRALAGFREPTPLVVDRPAPLGRTGHDAGTVERSLPRATSDALDALARREQVTLNTVVQAATGLLFARYSGQDDVVFGTAVSGRPPGLAGIESMLGLFLNTLPARVVSPPDRALGAQLRDVQERQLEMREHEHSALVDVQSWSEVDPGRPLFQSILVFESYPREKAVAQSAAAEAGAEPFAAVRDVRFEERTNLPLALVAAPLDRLFLRASFDTDRFDAATATRLVDHLENLLAAMANAPEAALRELALLSPAEAAALVSVPQPADAQGSFCLHRRFEQIASERPLAPAVTFGAETIPYGDLEARANRLAHRLRALGVGPEVRVALCLDRTAEMLVAILAVLKAGGAYVPLDPTYAQERLGFVLADAETPVVISQSDLADALPPCTGEEGGARLLLLDREDFADESAAPLADGATPDNAAYVIYTSGSTGKPKGVVVTHANVARLFRSTDRWFGFGTDDVWTLFHSYAFDFSVWEIWGALLYGGRLVVVPYAVSRSPRDFRALLAAERVTVLNQTPSAFHQLQRADEEAGEGAFPLALRTVVFGGEALDLGALAPWFGRHPEDRPRLVNMYGITETTVHVTYRPLGKADVGSASVIGEAIPDLALRLLDARGDLVPVGVPGEIHVVGDGLARGYLARPDLTAERFVPDAYSTLPGARSYRSGDLARRRPAALDVTLELEYLGRIDLQVKIRGFRIELGEIEAALTAHPSVREAVAVVRGDGDDRRLVAYLVAPPDAPLASFEAELREHLRARLPEHMLPSFLVPLAALPLTPNGKVDKKALPAPEIDLGGGFTPPGTPLELRLAEIWERLLGVAGVGLESDFFALGGHSLLAMRLSSHVREALELEIPVTLVFEEPIFGAFARTVEGMIEGLGEGVGGTAGKAARKALDATSAEPALVALARTGPVALSYSQTRLFMFDRLRPGDTLYNMGGTQRLGARLRLDLLAAAIDQVVRRHESLRTGFSEIDSHPVQMIHREVEVRPRLIDLSALALSRSPEPEMVRLSALQVGTPFDLGRPPLLSIWLVRLGAAGDVLLYMMHHIISDGWSMGVLVSELSAAYEALAAGRWPDLPALPVQYPDYAVWQRDWFERGELARQLGYWRERLAGAQPSELPTDRKRPAVSSFRGRRFRTALDSATSNALLALAHDHRASIFMMVLAGFDAIIARWSGRDDVVVGSPIANRQRREIEGLIGFFVNTLVLRTDLSGDPSFAEALDRTRDAALGAFGHQDLPFERLVEELAPRRDPARHPLFQLLFNLVNTPSETSAKGSPGFTAEADSPAPELQSATALFDLQLFGIETPGSIQLVWEYSLDLFEEATVRRFARGFTSLLKGALARPETRLSELPLLSAADRIELLAAAAGPSSNPLPDHFLHQRLAREAAARPDAPAVRFGGRVVTYAELDAASNRVARHLQALGFGVELTVGLCFDHCPELLFALFGVLKAGASFLPLDPGYPEERLSYQIADSGTLAVLTDEANEPLARLLGAPLVICVDGPEVAGESAEAPAPEGFEPERAAYLLYTSGSTGRPKGVVVTHRGLASLGVEQGRLFGVAPEGRVLQFASPAFDASVSEIAMAVEAGAALVMAPREVLLPGADFIRLLKDERVTTATLPPSLLATLPAGTESELPDLANLIVAGESCQPKLAARWAAGRRFLNAYGPTETTVCGTVADLSGATLSADRPLPLGQPLAHVQVRVVDRWFEPVPVGTPGEIVIGGVGLARNYHGRPDLTAERFVPDPLAGGEGDSPGGRIYRTGDLARWRPEPRQPTGLDLEYLGRIDFQIKIRGYRVELGEIEAALTAHPEVREAVVVVKGEDDDRRLIAYLAATPSPTLEAELREHLRTILPEYMVPGRFAMLAALPLTPNGKVDRKALPEPGVELVEGVTPPRTPVERRLAEIWEELLAVSGVGLESAFFELGGHSLLAMRLTSRILEGLGLDLPMQAIFDEPTLESLAARIETGLKESQGGVAAPALLPLSRGEALPLSFAQTRLWMLDRLLPGGSLYNMGGLQRLGSGLRFDLFAAAIEIVVRRHETLRTSFDEIDLAPIQIIHPEAAVRPRQIDLAALAAGEREMLRLGALQLAQPFDLGRPTLLRLWLVRLATESVLLYVIHHIVSDAWSMGLLISEITAAYAALAEGQRPDFPELPIQYADFSVWQRAWFEGGELDRQLGYWRTQLAGLPATELPVDRPRPPVSSYRGRRFRTALATDVAAALGTLAHERQASAFMVLLAGFDALVARYVGQDDVVIGTPVANRRRREVEGLIGFFVNTLVLRTDLDGDPSFAEAVDRTRETALGAFAHPDLPFERLVEELAPHRDMARNPLFQLMFNLIGSSQAEAGERSAKSPRDVGSSPAQDATALFDLQVYGVETSDSFDLHWEYSVDLFEEATMRRLARGYESLLAAAVARPESRLSDVPLLSAAERAELVAAGTGRAAGASGRVHERIREQAAATPAAIAFAAGSDTLTYAELTARANRLARRLARLGVGVESRVGIAVERSLALPVAALGVLGAGASYVPLDPAYPAERLAYMAADARLAALVVSGDLEDLDRRFAAYAPVVVRIAPDGEIDGAELSTPLPSRVGAENLAYTIYTSGSTGQPKGVELSHGALANFLDAMIERPGVVASDVLVSVTSLSFDIAGLELYAPLLVGARTVIARRDEATDGSLLAALLRRSGATVLQATPSGWRVLLAAGWTGDRSLKALVGGEALPPALAGELRSLVGSLWNMYGPTETAVWSTLDEVGAGPVSIGRPIAATLTYVVDRRGDLLPQGVPGELWIGGAGVARGYRGRPDLTAERFLPDPWSAESGARLYRTGDLGRWRPDGRLECLGRIDHQVKVRGHRIELGEIEAVLGSHPAVAASAVTLFGEGEDRRLAAYVVLRPGEEEEISLRDALAPFLLERLPESMMPSVFVRLAALPLTPNGKVDRKALPSPDFEMGAAATPPRTPFEKQVAAIWEEVLGVAGIGVESHFFALGGHSLLAMRLASRLRETFGLDLPLRAIFEASTLGLFAARVEAALAAGSEEAGGAEEALVPLPRTGPLPLSFAQARLWLLDRLAPGNPFYNLGSAIHLGRRLRYDLFSAAVGTVVARHESLRTSFGEHDREPTQTIHGDVGVRPRQIDLAGLAAPAAEALRLGSLQLAQPFDLGRPPLLRLWLVRLGAAEDALLYAIHHIVSDAWSLGLLVAEITASYAALAAGRAPELPALPVQYADFAAWQRSWLAEGELARQLDYWRGRLAGAPGTELPTDRPRPAVSSYRGRGLRTAVGPGLAAGVARIARGAQASPFMVLLAAFQAVVVRYGAGEDVVLGTPIANRRRREVERLIGFFVNTLVLRTDLAGDPSFAEALARTKETALGAFAYQDMPFERLVEELSPRRDLARNPFFQLMFNLINTPAAEGASRRDGAGEPPDTADRPALDVQPATALFDLQIYLIEAPDAFHLYWEYASDLFEEATIRRLGRAYESLIEGAVARPEGKLSDLPLLSAPERAELLATGTGPSAAGGGGPVHERIAAQALRTPAAVAVIAGTDALTYAELQERADRLARRLRRLGIGVESRVGIAVERSLALPVATLGVLGAGASYVPLDPAYPAERLAYMAADSGLAAVIASDDLADPERFAGYASIAVLIHPDGSIDGGEDAPFAAADTAAQNLAYTIYTSGSTGLPKGVELSHGALANFLDAMIERPGLDAQDVLVAVTSLSFDIAGLELYAPLLVGARTVIARQDEVMGGALLGDLLARSGATVLQATPSGWRVLLGSGWPGDPGLKALVGGEALPPALAAELRGKVGTLWNMYGPTETAVWSTVDEVGAGPISIGRPIAATGLYVVNAYGGLLPAGASGELWIGGAGVARGYHGRPDLTAERFLPDVYSRQPGARLYRTGDLARRMPDGRFQCLGRIDTQVKVRGFRIELGEVESVLAAHPRIAQSVVIARAGEAGAEHELVAYFVARDGDHGGEIATAELRAHLKERLPDYMVPAQFVRLDALPMTPNGKVDRKTLPDPSREARGGAGGELPGTEMEIQVAAVWRQVLHLESVGLDDNFFDLGGHSLVALKVQAQLELLLGRTVELVALFRHPTVRQLASALEPKGAAEVDSKRSSVLVPIQPLGTRAPLFVLPPLGGTVYFYRALAQELGPDQPVWGLQTPGLEGDQEPIDDFEALAELFLAAIAPVRRAGAPVHLAGASLGGLLVFEMARQLAARGEQMGMAALLDTAGGSATAIDDRAALVAMVHMLTEGRFRIPPEQLLGLTPDEQIDRVFAEAAARGISTEGVSRDRIARLRRVIEANLRARAGYREQTYSGSLLFCRAEIRLPGEPDRPETSWLPLAAGGVEVHDVPGDHESMLQPPNVARLAEILAAKLAE
ncbi:MAG: non-ribosomal peptide synthase/polyketide synthase [Acidobacteriota bacterium]